MLSCTHAVDEASERERALRQVLIEIQEKLVQVLREGDVRDKELNNRLTKAEQAGTARELVCADLEAQRK